MFFPAKATISAFIFSLTICSSYAFEVSPSSAKATDNKKLIAIPHITGEITIDANLDEPQWKSAKKVTMNIVTRPYDNTLSPVHTEALLMENNGVFYIAFIAEDPEPDQIRAFLKDRDKSWGELMVLKVKSLKEKVIHGMVFGAAQAK